MNLENIENDFEAVLETCVDQIATGATSFEECLTVYPEYAEEMAPILLAATELKRGRELRPSPFLKGRIQLELKYAMKNSPPQQRGLWTFPWRIALNVAVLMFTLIMTNTVFAQGALPGQSLYNWKLTSEHIWRSVSSDPLGTDLQLSNRRINEYVAVSNDETRRARVLTDYNELLTRFRSEQNQNNQTRIVEVLKSQQNSLHKVGLTIPELDRYFSSNSSSGMP
ncbi:MAG TPA: hypothetical protein VK909_22815 [Anaerolineales bacterium]|nr:hypothetical protein [Anaerolineales bacterium]